MVIGPTRPTSAISGVFFFSPCKPLCLRVKLSLQPGLEPHTISLAPETNSLNTEQVSKECVLMCFYRIRWMLLQGRLTRSPNKLITPSFKRGRLKAPDQGKNKDHKGRRHTMNERNKKRLDATACAVESGRHNARIQNVVILREF